MLFSAATEQQGVRTGSKKATPGSVSDPLPLLKLIFLYYNHLKTTLAPHALRKAVPHVTFRGHKTPCKPGSETFSAF